MAGGMDLGNGGKGGKKPLDVAINLVPFIDLMAVTISFLIMTAVWNQIGRLQVSSNGPSEQQEQPDKPPPPPVIVLITVKEFKVTVGGADFGTFPIVREGTDQRLNLTSLAAKLKEIRTTTPEQGTITVNPEPAVKYDDLVRIIDEGKGAGFQNVAVEAVMG
jgi:biopolymer transport protein TolR